MSRDLVRGTEEFDGRHNPITARSVGYFNVGIAVLAVLGVNLSHFQFNAKSPRQSLLKLVSSVSHQAMVDAAPPRVQIRVHAGKGAVHSPSSVRALCRSTGIVSCTVGIGREIPHAVHPTS